MDGCLQRTDTSRSFSRTLGDAASGSRIATIPPFARSLMRLNCCDASVVLEARQSLYKLDHAFFLQEMVRLGYYLGPMSEQGFE